MNTENKSAANADNVISSSVTEDSIEAIEEERFTTSLLGVGLIREQFSEQFKEGNEYNYSENIRENVGILAGIIYTDKNMMLHEFDFLRKEINNLKVGDRVDIIINDFINKLMNRCLVAPEIKTRVDADKYKNPDDRSGFLVGNIVMSNVFEWVAQPVIE